MCTCITMENQDFYFGRTMDIEYSFSERVVITPRDYPFRWRVQGQMQRHYAMIGMAAIVQNYPLYAEASNEKGLCIAGLNFPDNAVYQDYQENKVNITPYELIPWLLGNCASVDAAQALLKTVNLVNIPFSEELPLAPLHWMLADSSRCLVIESMASGLKIYENPIGVMTNNPPFDFHTTNLSNFMNLTSQYPENRFSKAVTLTPYGQGMGATGLPGDSSPTSRFVRAAFLKCNSTCETGELPNISQFFHILDSVSLLRGSVLTSCGACDMTRYACCVNAKKGLYYYKTYENSQINVVQLFREKLDSANLISYDLANVQQLHFVNG